MGELRAPTYPALGKARTWQQGEDSESHRLDNHSGAAVPEDWSIDMTRDCKGRARTPSDTYRCAGTRRRSMSGLLNVSTGQLLVSTCVTIRRPASKGGIAETTGVSSSWNLNTCGPRRVPSSEKLTGRRSFVYWTGKDAIVAISGESQISFACVQVTRGRRPILQKAGPIHALCQDRASNQSGATTRGYRV